MGVHLHARSTFTEAALGWEAVGGRAPWLSLVFVVSLARTLAAASAWSPDCILTWLPTRRQQREPVRVQVGDTGPCSQALGVSYSLSSQWGPPPLPPKSPPPPGPAHKDPREPLLWPDDGLTLASAQGSLSLPVPSTNSPISSRVLTLGAG